MIQAARDSSELNEASVVWRPRSVMVGAAFITVVLAAMAIWGKRPAMERNRTEAFILKIYG